MVLVVVRHAESIENADKYRGFYQNPRPYSGTAAHDISRHMVGLTACGFRQACWLGESLADLTRADARVYTSTYRRALDTAAIAFPTCETQPTDLLDEQHYGEATYMTKEELFATYPDSRHDRTHRKHQWIPPGGGESLADGVLLRAAEFVRMARADLHADCRAVIAMTHHSTILALRCLLEQRDLTELVAEARQAKTPLTGIRRYEITAGEFITINEAAPSI